LTVRIYSHARNRFRIEQKRVARRLLFDHLEELALILRHFGTCKPAAASCKPNSLKSVMERHLAFSKKYQT
jgi:hypothetical protein